MINTPSENVKLNFEQLQQIDVVEKRMSVLNSEIFNAQKILSGTKLEYNRAIKAKEYEEGLLASVTAQTDIANKTLTDLQTQISDARKVLTDVTVESQNIKQVQLAKSTEFDTRERQLIENEKDYTERSNKLDVREANIIQSESAVKEAKKAFEKAVESVKW